MDKEDVKNVIGLTFAGVVLYLVLVYGPMYIFVVLCPKIAQYLYMGDKMPNPFDPFDGGGWNS